MEIVSAPALHQDIARWVNERIPGEYYRQFNEGTKAIGCMDGDKLVAGVLYFGYTTHDINMAVAVEPGFSFQRRTLKAFFTYPFTQLNCLRVSAKIASRNLLSIKLVERVGFIYEGTIRHATPHDDFLLFGLLREDCKWLK